MSRVNYDFSDRVALVTGGTSGIGLAAVRAFARAGAKLAIAARSASACLAVERELAQGGVDAIGIAADVRDEAAVSALVERTLERFGRLDVAFNCAGIGDVAPLERTDQAAWDDVMAVNARGVWLAMRYEIPALLRSGGGAIVNMSSIFGAAGNPVGHAYAASKHAVIGMTRSVALEYAARGVRVNALCAGVTETEGVRQAAAALPDVIAALVERHPMKRMASEDEITNAALWLCSDAAGFVTGSALAVDGGFAAA